MIISIVYSTKTVYFEYAYCDNRENWTKYFFIHYLRIKRRIQQDRWLNIPAKQI